MFESVTKNVGICDNFFWICDKNLQILSIFLIIGKFTAISSWLLLDICLQISFSRQNVSVDDLPEDGKAGEGAIG